MTSDFKNEVFALDIGTRSVVGIIINKEENKEKYYISDYEIVEHDDRSMYDGQIHNIDQVIKVVSKIKSKLEERAGKKFSKVAVAAAGRSLYTIESYVERDISPNHEITETDIKSLEWDAINKALRQINGESKDKYSGSDYHCIGYSVVNYKIDDQKIGNLFKQKGKKIGVTILATFLPRIVVDSLLTVIYESGLELQSITLEPIAASCVVIPQNMRRLNVALVDIGAGTSDIAITKRGSISAYGMVPIAGDEITDKLCERFLLDYDTGEFVKRQLNEAELITFVDILGNKYTLKREEIIEEITEIIEVLAMSISEKIIEINNGAPNAVICIGGGSLTPKLPEKIAYNLGVSRDRVGVRGSDVIKNISNMNRGITGPFGVTPVGIAISSLELTGLNMINVFVNDVEVQLFEFETPTVSDALMQCNISPVEIYGAPGMALTFELNGKVRIAKGTLGEACKIKVNGKKAELDTGLHNNDKIAFVPGNKGVDATAKIKDFLPKTSFKKIVINNKEVSILPDVYIDDKKVPIDTSIRDGSKIMIDEKDMILIDVLNYISLNIENVTGNLVTKINGKDANFTSQVKDGDKVDIYYENI